MPVLNFKCFVLKSRSCLFEFPRDGLYICVSVCCLSAVDLLAALLSAGVRQHWRGDRCQALYDARLYA